MIAFSAWIDPAPAVAGRHAWSIEPSLALDKQPGVNDL
jgi:hypothetical protein